MSAQFFSSRIVLKKMIRAAPCGIGVPKTWGFSIASETVTNRLSSRMHKLAPQDPARTHRSDLMMCEDSFSRSREIPTP
jgi:hypothetical protein